MVQVQRVWNDTMKCRTKGPDRQNVRYVGGAEPSCVKGLKDLMSSCCLECQVFFCALDPLCRLCVFYRVCMGSLSVLRRPPTVQKTCIRGKLGFVARPVRRQTPGCRKKRLFVSDPTESVLTVQRQTNQRLATGGGVRKGDKDKERKWEESGDQGKGWEWDTGKKEKKKMGQKRQENKDRKKN